MPKPLRTSLVLVLLTLLYILAFPRPTGLEPLLVREWALSLDEEQASASAAAARILPFRLGPRFGYFTSDGRLRHSEAVRYGLAQDARRFANYSVISENIVLQDTEGALLRSIAAVGYPFLDRGRLYVFAPDGSTVSEWSTDGEQRWERDFVSVVTDLDAGDTRSVVGLLDGRVHVLDERGEDVYSYRTDGSRLQVTLSVAIGRDEDVVAAVAGIDPQRLVVFEEHTEGFFPVFQLDVGSAYRRPLLIEFLRDGSTLVVEQPGGLLVYDRERESFGRIDLGGEAETVDVLDDPPLIVSISRLESLRRDVSGSVGTRMIRATVRPDMPLFSQQVESEHTFLDAVGSRIYFGLNGRIACVELVRG